MRSSSLLHCPSFVLILRILPVRYVPAKKGSRVEFLANVLSVLIFLTSLIMILLILIQRGRGGGLIGALGGSGGSSPFGSRAGDTFTRITLITAAIWIVLIMVQILVRPG